MEKGKCLDMGNLRLSCIAIDEVVWVLENLEILWSNQMTETDVEETPKG